MALVVYETTRREIGEAHSRAPVLSLPCSTPMGDVVVLLYNQREGQIAADYCFVLLVYSPIISLPFIIVL